VRVAERVALIDQLTDGRVEVELRGQSSEALAREVAGFGAGLEVVAPDDVREYLATIAVELSAAHCAR